MASDIAVLIVAAGRGERAGGAVPKQFALLSGVAVLARAIDAFGSLPVFVVVGAGQRALMTKVLGARAVMGEIDGGATRQASVKSGLAAIASVGGFDKVLIHDAARPLLPQRVLDDLIAALDRHVAAVPALSVADTLARAELAGPVEAPFLLGETVDRSQLCRIQTPQAFHLTPLLAALEAWSGGAATDESQVMRAAGYNVAVVPGDFRLEKITHAADFARAEALLAARMVSRSAMGFDVHRLETGEELWLGGIRIEHTHGLSGHSDADVALHAITDALLGSIGAGDIGMHFPPSDTRWRGATSDRFLVHAVELLQARGGIVDFVDLTLICEAPKIGPHRDAMQSRIAGILRVPPSQVSIKATTTERLGFTGRGEGIAAQAIATVRLPEEL